MRPFEARSAAGLKQARRDSEGPIMIYDGPARGADARASRRGGTSVRVIAGEAAPASLISRGEINHLDHQRAALTARLCAGCVLTR